MVIGFGAAANPIPNCYGGALTSGWRCATIRRGQRPVRREVVCLSIATAALDARSCLPQHCWSGVMSAPRQRRRRQITPPPPSRSRAAPAATRLQQPSHRPRATPAATRLPRPFRPHRRRRRTPRPPHNPDEHRTTAVRRRRLIVARPVWKWYTNSCTRRTSPKSGYPPLFLLSRLERLVAGPPRHNNMRLV